MSNTELAGTVRYRLWLIRDYRGWTQEQAQHHTGVPKAQISHYETKMLPTLTNLKRLCDGYDCSVDWIMGRSDKMEVGECNDD